MLLVLDLRSPSWSPKDIRPFEFYTHPFCIPCIFDRVHVALFFSSNLSRLLCVAQSGLLFVSCFNYIIDATDGHSNSNKNSIFTLVTSTST
jgi:hypothetical protein